MLQNLKQNPGPKEARFLKEYQQNIYSKFAVTELTEEQKQEVLTDKTKLIDIVIGEIEDRFANHEMIKFASVF